MLGSISLISILKMVFSVGDIEEYANILIFILIAFPLLGRSTILIPFKGFQFWKIILFGFSTLKNCIFLFFLASQFVFEKMLECGGIQIPKYLL